jgi:hypothetical protein
MVSPTCLGITLPFLGSVPSAFWEMLNWGAVDRILCMGLLCIVTWKHHVTKHKTPIHNILSTAAHLNISKKALATPAEDGNVIPKHVGITVYN